MRSLGLLLFPLVFGVAVPAAEQDTTEKSKWTNHESLKTPDTAEADWQARGKGSKVEVTAKGLLLVGDSRMASRFQLADGARIKFTYVTKNRNAVVHLCGKELKVKAPDGKGSQVYVLDIVRNGRALVWGVSIIDAKGRVVGKPVNSDAIRLDAAEVDKPTRVVFGSQGVGGRGDSNSIGDIRFKSIVVSGPVLPAAADSKEKKK